MTGTVLHVQSVLYRNDEREIARLAEGLRTACRHAANEGLITSARLHLGDCSPTPCLGADAVAALTEPGSDGAGFSVVDYEFFDANLGSALGHNRLAAKSDAGLIMIVNPDTYPTPFMLVEMIGALVRDPAIGIVEARQIPLEHPKAYDVRSGDTSWASTCCIVTPREIFDEEGGFDHEHFPLYCDDVDYAWRVRLRGSRVVFVPRAVIVHDKRLHPGGGIVASEVEQYSGALARMMLATKYDRPDILEETRAYIRADGSEPQRRALAEFEAREAAGSVPTPLAGAARVAQFTGGAYAVHRF